MRFFVGDDNGQLKSVKCSKSSGGKWSIEASTLDDGGLQGKTRAVQRLAVRKEKIALARSDGSCTLFCAKEGADSVQTIQQWHETRFKSEHRYIGLDIIEGEKLISCTSAGHLRLQHPPGYQPDISANMTSIPSRLGELVVADDGSHFAYGGDEVEVSVWDTSRAFNPSRRLLPVSTTGTKRRKEHSELIEGEIWRAKNVSNDFLNLRQPVHNTALAFISPSGHQSGPSHHLVAGTRIGSVRRYDTRAARKPVADWKDIGKVGGVRKVQKGMFEYETFVADHGSNLFALDFRTGRVLYAYSGIAGAISSIASTSSSLSPPLLASVSLDRFFRLHSTYEPPKIIGSLMNKKGEILGKHWIKSAAGCVSWDGVISKEATDSQEESREQDDVWGSMHRVGEEQLTPRELSESEDENCKSKHKKQRAHY